MLENLQAPVDAWVVFLLFIIVIIAINRKADKPGTQVSKKKNFKTQLAQRVYKMPKQEQFDISIYGEVTENAVASYKNKLVESDNLAGVWENFEFAEKEAFILKQFEFIQQYFNCLDEKFIIERTNETMGTISGFDGPYTAIVLNIYRAEEKIGNIEVEPETFGDSPTAILRCKLRYAEMFQYESVYNLFKSVASVHFDEESPNIQQEFEVEITRRLTHYLWDRLNSDAEAEYDGIDWHKFEALEMSFTGEFKAYSNYRKNILDRDDPLDVFKAEASSIKNLMEHYGYEQN